MKPTIAVMLMALVLHACSPLHRMQKVESQVPGIGSIGTSRSSLFKKDFLKVGEPLLEAPVSVSVQSVALTASKKAKYAKYLKAQALEPMVELVDTTAVQPRYYEMQITDMVGMGDQLNNTANKTLRQYLQEDQGLELLTKISFMGDKEMESQIKIADRYFLESKAGALVLKIGHGNGAQEIKMASLQIFDFESSSFCWKRNKRGQVEIAHILVDGNGCPGETESDPSKLDPFLDYSKL